MIFYLKRGTISSNAILFNTFVDVVWEISSGTPNMALYNLYIASDITLR